MTQVKIQDGSVVENTITNESDECTISELYTWVRVLKNYQRNFKQSVEETRQSKDEYSDDYSLPDDSEIARYAEFLRNIEINGIDSGEMQRAATDFTGDDYFSNHNLGEAIDVLPANESEQKIAPKIHRDLSNRDKRVLKHFEETMVPVTPDKEEMPLVVASNDHSSWSHTFDEAVKMWESFVDHIDVVVDGTEPSEEDASSEANNDDDNDSDSDQEETHLMSDVDKVGPATAENIRNYLIENRVTLDWREQIDGEAWYEAPTVIDEEEARERLQQVALDMDSDEFQKAMQLIESGETQQAVMAIKQYE